MLTLTRKIVVISFLVEIFSTILPDVPGCLFQEFSKKCTMIGCASRRCFNVSIALSHDPRMTAAAPSKNEGRKEGTSHQHQSPVKGRSKTYLQHSENLKTAPQKMKPFPIVNLPLDIQKCILRSLLKSTNPFILTLKTPSLINPKPQIQPQILQVSSQFYQLGRPILYGENTFTISSSAASCNFDNDLTNITRQNRRLITSVILRIEWAEHSWIEFLLSAKDLAELPLRILVIWFVEKSQRPSKRRLSWSREMARHGAKRDRLSGEKNTGDTLQKAEKGGNESTSEEEEEEEEQHVSKSPSHTP